MVKTLTAHFFYSVVINAMSFFNFNGFLSPPKRELNATSPIRPFCTSPSQLQEVTLDQDATFSNTMGLRSPGGPMRGRSVKEIEEQLSNLKKENFNLKLRIYFLEEKMGTNFTLDKDNIVKKNIELQIEIANLQKEVQEKHELLCQAVKAMELEEEEHKKYITNKEDEMNMCQQELEDLRMQLQETKFDSDGISLKSDTTGFYSSRATNSGNSVNDLQEKIKLLETELHLEKENNASLQFAIAQTETLRSRYENMQKECVAKDETIKHLHEEIENANDKIKIFNNQLRDYQDKFETSLKENHSLSQKLQAESKRLEDITTQNTDIRKKYSMVRSEFEREQKKVERMKILNDMKISEMEEENQKQKLKIRDLQAKLEAALVEIRKNQNLAVSKSLVQKTNISNTDLNSLSVSNPATSPGTSKKDSLYVQISSVNTTPLSSSSSPSKKSDTSDLEELLQNLKDSSSNDKILSYFHRLKKENSSLNQKIIKLKSEQMKACEIIKTMMEARNKANDEIAKLKAHVKQLEHELESVVTHPTNEGDNIPLKQRVTDMNIKAVQGDDEKPMAESQCDDKEVSELYKALVNELETKVEVLVATLNEKDSQMQKIREQHEEILTSLEEKENRIVDLEFELISIQQDGRDVDQSLLDKGDNSSEKHSSFYRQEMEEKDKEIKRLSDELRKCTCYLQEIVNKELWDKNKEVEKLRSKQTNSPEFAKLKKDLFSREQQLKILTEKISELGLDIDITKDELCDVKTATLPPNNVLVNQINTLQDELKICKEEREYFKEKLKEYNIQKSADLMKQLQTQNENLKSDLEKSEELKLKSNEICSILNTRLEELAVFLDSLLKQKLLLGFLGSHKERKLREIINTSLDLSKSFAMSMIINPDQSLAQLSNISSLLNGSAFQDLTLDPPQTDSGVNEDHEGILKIMPESITLTYQNHLYKCGDSIENKDELITTLRQQIFSLKSELQLRDNELNKLNTFKELSDKSTDTDVEIKQKFSSSKLFGTPKSNTTSTTLRFKSECQSESEAWSEPDRVVSRARIGLNQSPQTVIKDLQVHESTEDETRLSSTPTKKSFEKRYSFTDLHQQIVRLQEEVENKNQQLVSADQKLVSLMELDSKLADTKNKLIETERNRAEIEFQVVALKNLVDELNQTNKELKETMLSKDKETQNKINQLLIEKDQATLLAQKFENEVLEAKLVIKEIETNIQNAEKEKIELEENLRKEFMQFTASKLKSTEEEYLKKLKIVENKAEQDIKNIQEKCEQDCFKKSQVEINKLRKELDDLKDIVKSYEETIQCYKGKEDEFKRKSQDYQEKINTLRKEVDNITLRYSEAVLEKTKLSNEKTQLEQETNKNAIRTADLKQQFGDISTEFEKVRSEHQKQISSLQKQKSKLEMKITELESTNADLHNRLVRYQAGRGDFNLSLPNNMYKRQFSDQPYSSEDNVEECSGLNYTHPAVRNLQPVDLDRQEANSSPDLGIESDHGRFSSLETHTTLPRPLLQTLELTESMNNLLSADNTIPIEGINCESDHCCQRILEIARENNDLKRKLYSLRRALQETLNQLNLANQRKKQVEKTICKQIHKTSQVLRKAKANLDSGSDSDMLNKM